jgi:hypothetical protein
MMFVNAISGSLDVSVAGLDGQGHIEAGGPHGGSGGGGAGGSIYLETSSQTFRDQQFARLNVDGGSVGTHYSSGNGAPGGLGRKVARVFGSTDNYECLNLDDNACAEPTDREQFCHGLNDETLGFQIVKFEFAGTYAEERNFCEKRGGRLPYLIEICSAPQVEPAGGFCDGVGAGKSTWSDNKWAAIKDTANEYFGCSSDLQSNNSLGCRAYAFTHKAVPTWGTSGADTRWKGWTYCRIATSG